MQTNTACWVGSPVERQKRKTRHRPADDFSFRIPVLVSNGRSHTGWIRADGTER